MTTQRNRLLSLDRRRFLQVLGAAGLGGCAMLRSAADVADDAELPLSGDLSPVHDPCIIKAGGLYHVFSTGQVGDEHGLVAWRTSPDLRHWTWRGAVFDAIPQWASAAIPGTRGIWAPDIAYFNDRFHLYYSVSTFGSNRSAIGLATAAWLDPENPALGWEDHGPVIESHRGDDFNAIDANHLEDADGRHWLSFGSFWSGLRMVEIEPATGKPLEGASPVTLASRPVPEGAPGAVEAPFIIRHGAYYYLFASYDYCCRGVASSYYLVVGRATRPTGPYLGRDDRRMLDGYGTLLLRGNRQFRGPGHNAVLVAEDADYLVYHAYDASNGGAPTLRIRPLRWTEDAWPAVDG